VSQVPFHPAAEEEFLEAVAAYEAERPGLGAEFLAEVERATRRIISFPAHGSPYLAGTRRIVLRRFPYSVVYRRKSGDSLVVAIAHQRRKPGYWRNRLSRRDKPEARPQSSSPLTAETLLRFTATLEGKRIQTLAQRAVFTVRVLPAGVEITPVSTRKPRLVAREVVDRVCEEYSRSHSMQPGHYQAITFDASYLLALISRYLER
jgi:plasmid stabilization system protein ParE